MTLIIRCKNAISNIQLPDRTKIFMSSLWFWVYIMYYFTKIINMCLGVFLIYTPDSLIIYNPFRIKTDININKPIIIDARMKTKDNTHENITNKLRELINHKWDIDIGNDNCPFDETKLNKELFGGIDMLEIVKVYPTLSTAIIWITYLFETDKKLTDISDAELGKKIKHMLINISDKVIYRTSDLKNPENIIANEIIF